MRAVTALVYDLGSRHRVECSKGNSSLELLVPKGWLEFNVPIQ